MGLEQVQRKRLRYVQESLEHRAPLGRTLGIADSLHTIAQMQDDAGRAEAALKNYHEALDLRRTIGDKQGIGNVLNDLGTTSPSRGQYDDALTQFKEALQIQREVRNPVDEAAALNNVGTIYLCARQLRRGTDVPAAGRRRSASG